MDIYLLIDGQQQGPYTEEQVRRKLYTKQFSPTSQAWHEGLDEWIALGALLDPSSKVGSTSRTKLSVCRDGKEIGEWSGDEVRVLYAEGRLVASDLYWTEGMAGWASLAGFIKPPPPFPTSVAVTAPDAEVPIMPPPVDLERKQRSFPRTYLPNQSSSIETQPSKRNTVTERDAKSHNEYAGSQLTTTASTQTINNSQEVQTNVKQGAADGGAICFVIGIGLMHYALLHESSLWLLLIVGPLFLASFILSIVAMAQARIVEGISLLLATIIGPCIMAYYTGFPAAGS